MGKHEEALKDFDRAIELDEKGAWVIASRGDTYRQMGKYTEALADYNQAIEIDEKYAKAMENRGLIYRLMERYEEALADYRRAIELESANVNANMALAACYRRLGLMDEYDRQVACVRELVIKESDYTRACFAAICGENDEALALLRATLEKGEISLDWTERDPDFDLLRDDPRFAALIEEMKARLAA
jgi:tetratricopeptide (TPR) repeat protein